MCPLFGGKVKVVINHPGKDSSSGLPEAGVVSLYNQYSPDYAWAFEGKKSFEWLGVRIVEIPDYDFDGEADLVVSAPFAKVGGNDETGLLRIISSSTGSQIKRLLGEEAYEEFGFSLVGTGSEGYPRVCVGSPGWTPSGANYPDGRIQTFAFNPQLSATPDSISISQGGTIQLEADFSSDAVSDLVFPVASRVGIGTTTVFGLEISIASGPLLRMGLTSGYPMLLPKFGYLNAQGDWSSTLDLPPSSQSITGQDLFVVVVHAPFPFLYGVASSSYPVRIRILP